MPTPPAHDKNNETFESISIWGECGEFSIPKGVWLTVLNVGELYGWKRAGTDPPDAEFAHYFVDGPAHHGEYYPPNGQRVSQKDAQHLAQALARALLDIPDGTTERKADPFVGWDEKSSSLMERLGTIRPILQSLIEHCWECGELWLC